MIKSLVSGASGLLTGQSASSVFSSASESLFSDNINTSHSVKTFLTYYGSANSGAKNELITNYWFIPIMNNFLPNDSNPAKNFARCGLSTTACQRGELEYHILDVQIPQYGIETISYSDMTGSYNRPGQSIANAMSKTFSIQILNTKLNLIDTVFASWIAEVGAATWIYDSVPYAVCDFSVVIYTPGIKSGSLPSMQSIPFIGADPSTKVNAKLNSGLSLSNATSLGGVLNDENKAQAALESNSPESGLESAASGNYNISTYTFKNCYPINIELYNATNNSNDKFTRSVTFSFDTLHINAYYPSPEYNSTASIIGGTLLKLGMPIVNKLSMAIGDKINSALDNTIGKLSKKITDKINAGSAKLVSFGTNLNKPKTSKINYKFVNGNTGNTKTSDIKSTDIRRTFQTTF